MSEKVKGILLREETLEAMLALTDEQRGRLVLALFADSGMCEEPELDPVTRVAFLCLAPGIRRAQDESYRRYAANVENGKKGGRPKKQSVQEAQEETDGITEKPMGFEDETQKPKPIQTNPNQVKLNNIKTPLSPLRGQGGAPGADAPAPGGGSASVKEPYTQEFEAFWKAYPRKTAKDAAFRAWKAKKREGKLPVLSVLADAIGAAKRTDQWQRDGGQYIPHPATWLNQGRWMDEQAQEESAFRIPQWARSENS